MLCAMPSWRARSVGVPIDGASSWQRERQARCGSLACRSGFWRYNCAGQKSLCGRRARKEKRHGGGRPVDTVCRAINASCCVELLSTWRQDAVSALGQVDIVAVQRSPLLASARPAASHPPISVRMLNNVCAAVEKRRASSTLTSNEAACDVVPLLPRMSGSI